MIERKIIRLCDSYLITLPKLWALNLGLKEGDMVGIIMKENYLKIIPLLNQKDKKICREVLKEE